MPEPLVSVPVIELTIKSDSFPMLKFALAPDTVTSRTFSCLPSDAPPDVMKSITPVDKHVDVVWNLLVAGSPSQPQGSRRFDRERS